MSIRSSLRLLYFAIGIIFTITFPPRVYARDVVDPFVLIVQGAGGEEVYSRRFSDWGRRLREFLTTVAEIPATNIIWLGEEPEPADAPPTLENIRSAVARVLESMPPGGDLLIFLIGHGSYIAGESRFMIPGDDMTTEHLTEMLEGAQAGRIVLVDSTASSSGYINALSRPGRIIITATKSVNERNATQFMESFLQGLEDESADQNRDGRISLLEAARQADRLTTLWFESKGYLLTEHPLIDDNGDGLGTRLGGAEPGDPVAQEASLGEGVALDGAIAARYYLKDFSFPPEVPEALAGRYIELLDEVETLKSGKAAMDAASYRNELESLLIEAAKVHREIRRIINEAGPDSSAQPDTPAKDRFTPDVSSQ